MVEEGVKYISDDNRPTMSRLQTCRPVSSSMQAKGDEKGLGIGGIGLRLDPVLESVSGSVLGSEAVLLWRQAWDCRHGNGDLCRRETRFLLRLG